LKIYLCSLLIPCSLGHHDWAQTFHRVPKLVDSTLEKLGGIRLAPTGLTDAAERDMFSDFETWEDGVLWPALAMKYNVTENDESGGRQAGFSVTVSNPRSSALRQDVQEAIVAGTVDLTRGEAAKKHIEIKLPTNMTYNAGDYLAVLPLNPRENVNRAMRKFQLAWDSHITISSDGRTTLPTNQSLPASDILSAYVELAQPATKRVSNRHTNIRDLEYSY
jgi:cytochrome P450 / NADPH-cytochrome P450 reductase